ncbi:hypothetical protein [Neobacillus sp. PS3-40]|uniref:hypothetical protein n=1 Tax=Neobacillus sp. PS3-40 TaxID=3070679 RepID=UPI0027E015CD|nr:hypothetical protein [Neobacillus sp. PS3-40]WML43084.1 hypothetical protein RCG20_14905 [Neobacillus sp. PS3-40]
MHLVPFAIAFALPFHVHSFTFIIAIETLLFSIILRSKGVFLLQLVLFLATFAIDGLVPNSLNIFLIIVQILLGIICLYKIKKAAEMDYLLVLEKTHRIPPNLTKGSNFGNRSSFFR